MTADTESVGGRARGDVLAPTASSLRMRAVNGAASAAGAAPGVADPVQPVAAKGGVFFAKPYWADDDVVLGARVSLDTGGWYVSCNCGWTTGYCESNAQASRIAAYHSREAHDL